MISPRVISLDLDDTLWPVGPVIAAAEAALLAWLRARHPRVAHGHDLGTMQALRARVAEEHPGRSHDLTFLRRQALAEQFSRAGIGHPDLDAAVDAALELFLMERNRVEFYVDVLPALERLRRSYRLFAVSNGNAELGRCGLGELFDGHVTAAAAGAAKPDGRIFAQLERLAGVAACEILHVGDDPLADVVGATRAGMQSVWLNRDARAWPPEFAPPSRIVSSLAEIR